MFGHFELEVTPSTSQPIAGVRVERVVESECHPNEGLIIFASNEKGEEFKLGEITMPNTSYFASYRLVYYNA